MSVVLVNLEFDADFWTRCHSHFVTPLDSMLSTLSKNDVLLIASRGFGIAGFAKGLEAGWDFFAKGFLVGSEVVSSLQSVH